MIDIALPALVFTARLILGSTLLFAGIRKLGDRESFRQALNDYHLLPTPLHEPASLVLPGVEVMLGSLLFLWPDQGLVAWGIAALLTGFTIAIIINLIRKREIDCGCFNNRRSRISWLLAGRNSALVGLAVVTAESSLLAPRIGGVIDVNGSLWGVTDALLAIIGIGLGTMVAIQAVRLRAGRPSSSIHTSSGESASRSD